MKKTVQFASDTIFAPGREIEEFLRGSVHYVSGKYACLEASGEWLDTSLMTDTLEQLLNLKVYGTHTVGNKEEINSIHDKYVESIEAGRPLCSGLKNTLRWHRLRQEVSNEYVSYLENCAIAGLSFAKDELAHAKVLVIYQGYDHKLLGFQFLRDTGEDSEADEYMMELKKTIPKANQGVPPHTVLNQARND
jgi:hypothetical protein